MNEPTLCLTMDEFQRLAALGDRLAAVLDRRPYDSRDMTASDVRAFLWFGLRHRRKMQLDTVGIVATSAMLDLPTREWIAAVLEAGEGAVSAGAT